MCFDTAELLNWSILKKVYSQHLKSSPGELASPLDKVISHLNNYNHIISLSCTLVSAELM